MARRIFERFCASAISRAASSSSRSSVFIGASFGARFIVDSSGAFGAGFTAALGVRTGSGSFFASSDFVVFDAHDGGARPPHANGNGAAGGPQVAASEPEPRAAEGGEALPRESGQKRAADEMEPEAT